MTDDSGAIDGGQVDLKVVADLSDFTAAKLQREIDAKIARVRADILAKIDAKKVETEAKTAASAAERAASVKVRMTFDRRKLRDDLKAALADASAGSDVTITPDVDQVGMLARLRSAMASLRGQTSLQVPVETDTQPAEDEVERTRRRVEGKPWNVKLGDGLLKLATIPAIAAGVGFLVGAVGQLGAGLFAVAAGAGQAVGVLGLIPGIAAAGIQGIAGLVVGLQGVGTALGALAKRDAQAGASGAAAAAAREAAAQRIKSAAEAVKRAEEHAKEAVEAIKRARENAAEVAVSVAQRNVAAAQRIADAQRREADSHRATQRAIEALNEARKQAIERIEDLRIAVAGGALDEESAQLAIERAKARLEAVTADPFASDLDKREADLAYRQALQRLTEVRERNGDLAEEQADANAKGVEGSDQVVAAKERLADAQRAEIDAARAVTEARREADQVAVEGAKAILAAEKAIAEAIKARREADAKVREAKSNLVKAKTGSKSGAGGGGVDPAEQALANLTPGMRKFVLYLHNTVRPALSEIRKETQEALAPGLMAGVKAAMPLLAVLRGGMRVTGTVVGQLATEFGQLVGSKGFGQDLSQVMSANNIALSNFGRAGIQSFSAVVRIMRLAGPFVVLLSKRVKDLATRFNEFTGSSDGQERIRQFFQRAWVAASRLWRILSGVTRGLLSLGKAAAPSGGTLLEDLAQGAERFAKWAADPATQAKAREFFDGLVPVMREVGGLFSDLGGLIGDLTGGLDPSSTVGFLSFLRDIVGVFRDIAQSDLGQSAIGGLIGPLGALLLVVAKFGGLGAAAKVLKAVLMSPVTAVKAGIGAGKFVGGLAGKAPAKGATGAQKAGAAVRSFAGTAAEFAGGLAGKVRDALGKVNLKGALKKVNPKDLIGKATSKIDISGWFSKINPSGLIGKGTGAAKGAASGAGRALASGVGKLGTWAKSGATALGTVARAAGTAAVQLGGLALTYGRVALAAGLAGAKQLVMAAASGIVRVATLAWTGVQWLLNVALNANPIGLIVLAVAALVGAVIWAYNNVGWFRNAVDTAFKAIGAVVSWAWNTVLKPALSALSDFVVHTLAPNALWLWKNVIVPAWDAISKAISKAWNDYLKPAWSAIVAFVRDVLAPNALWLWKNVIVPAWDAISKAISKAWNDYIKPALQFFWTFITKTLPDGFTKGVDAIKKIWDRLKEIAAVPVEFVVNTVYNKGIREAWNAIATKVNLAPLPQIAFKGFASGGPISGPGGPTADKIPIMASDGEYVVNARQTRRWFPLIDAINRGLLPRFAGGGEVLAGLLGGVKDLLKKGAGTAARSVLLPLKGMVDRGVGASGFGRLIGAVPKRAIDGILALFDAKDRAAKANGGKYARGGLVGRMPAFAGGGLVSGAAGLYAASRSRSSFAVATAGGGGDGGVQLVQHIHPQPGQDEYTIASISARKLGARVRR